MSSPTTDTRGGSAPGDLEPEDYPRKVLFVAGAGRSGTSTLSGLMQLMGLHVPQPEVVPDESNPKGFGEPAWVVEHHDRLLKDAGVQVSDARPDAWFETGRVSTREPERIRTAEWLDGHFAVNHELVVKDPRLSWFLGLWRVAAIRDGAVPVFATMLRPPSEVVGSKQKYYANRLGSAHLAASWLNMLLHTERATRESVADGGRVFVRYGDLLDDWVKVVMQLGEQLELQNVLHAKSEQIRDGHRFVDPGLRRVTQSLADLQLPPKLHDLTGQTWDELNKLAEPGGDTAEAHTTLDQLREAYVDLYAEAEAISRSSVVAAEQRVKRELKGGRAAARRGGRGAARPRRPDPARPARHHPARRTPRRAQGAGARAVTVPAAGTGSAEPRGTHRLRHRLALDQARGLRPGTTAVLRVKNEAPSLPWVLPPLLRACDEVLLVDNGSTDGTPEVAAETVARSGRGDKFSQLPTRSTSRGPAPSTWPSTSCRCTPSRTSTTGASPRSRPATPTSGTATWC